jgi:hypothetical protein
MIVPTITSVYAQVAMSQQTQDVRNRTYGPGANQTATTTTNTIAVNNNNSDPITTINSTATEGIQNMRTILLKLEPSLEEYNLTNAFNGAVMSLAHIQGNVSELQEHIANQTNASATQIAQLQRELTIARGALLASQQQLEDSNAEVVELEAELEAALETTPAPEPEPEPTPAPEPQTELPITSPEEEEEEDSDADGGGSTSEEEEEENAESDGPRLDPEGDGGFPGDIDG